MKKAIVLVAVFSMVIGMGSADAKHPKRSVAGSIKVPTEAPEGVGLLSRHARCAYLLAGERSNGVFGWAVPLKAQEADGKHPFKLTGAGANFDIIFYSDLGTCQNAPPSVTTKTFEGGGNESGKIPAKSSTAIIVMRGAANSFFTLAIG